MVPEGYLHYLIYLLCFNQITGKLVQMTSCPFPLQLCKNISDLSNLGTAEQ